MTPFEKLATIPAKLIERGLMVPVSISRPATGTFNPKALGKPSQGSPTTINGYGLLSTVTKASDAGTLVTATVAKLTIEPMVGDRLNFAGRTYQVMSVNEIAPNGTAILFEAVVQ